MDEDVNVLNMGIFCQLQWAEPCSMEAYGVIMFVCLCVCYFAARFFSVTEKN